MVPSITSQENFNKVVAEKQIVIVFFWASWHEPSAPGGQMDQVFSVLAERFTEPLFIKVEAEEVPEVSARFQISVVPTFIFLKAGNVVDKLEGANPQELKRRVEVISQTTVSNNTEQNVLTPQLTERLRALIRSAPVMLFMKGSPENPKCKFSRRMIEILMANDIKFASFDILTNEEVRQGLKVLSDWPTFPQLYVNGELVGGVDIIEELQSNGDLKSQLGIVEKSLNDRLKELINRSKVMLFMKGSSENPRCGFSRDLVKILKEANIQFDTFDILTDEEIRQGLKTYSDWPTYPQLYVNGQLIGGLDIVKEMKETGDLAEQLGVTQAIPLEQRLRTLINQSPIMLFMKGTPDHPKCGFSSQMIEILRSSGFQFGSFDILTDEEIRQGLKKLSNWPTYPQLYIDGELIGGLDIVRELQENGELDALKK